MTHVNALRRAAVILAAAVLASAGLGFVASPVYAADPHIYVSDVRLTPGMTAESPGRAVTTRVLDAGDLADVSVEFDIAALGDAVRVTPPAGCTEQSGTLRCPVQPVVRDGGGVVTLILRAGGGTAEVTLNATVTGPHLNPASDEGKVIVAHGADLIPDEDRTTLEAETRGPVALPLRFTNWGDEAADGFDLMIGSGIPFDFEPGCVPAPSGEAMWGRCAVHERVERGRHYTGTPHTFTMSSKVGVAEFAYYVKATGRSPGAPTYTQAYFVVHATSGSATDIALEGGTATGAVGETVTIALTVRNLGPADLRSPTQDGGGQPLVIFFESPTGTEYAGGPDTCRSTQSVPFEPPFPNGEATQQHGSCDPPVLPSGASITFDLRFTILREVTAGYGRVLYRAESQPDFLDPGPGNDTTNLVVSTSGAAGSLPAPSTGGQAARPAATRVGWQRAGGVTAVVVAIGAALLVVMVRRRRAGRSAG